MDGRQVNPDHYCHSYDTKERFISYWYQINEITKLKPKNVLEIGMGSGFISKYLREHEIKIHTLDFDSQLKPDYVGSVLDIPFSNDAFDLVSCFQVLEHLPYENFERAISEIFRITSSYALLSLPDATLHCRINLYIPKVGEMKRIVDIPLIQRKPHHFDGQHYWEIGKKGTPLRKIIVALLYGGFSIEKTYRIFEYPYHRFFILRKSKNPF